MAETKICFHVDEPIYGPEGTKLEQKISHLIGRHNVLCRIEQAFSESETALKYFDDARNEVLGSGNCSMAAMYAITIHNMSEKLQDYDEDNLDEDQLRMHIYHLESENRKLKMKLEKIAKAVNC